MKAKAFTSDYPLVRAGARLRLACGVSGFALALGFVVGVAPASASTEDGQVVLAVGAPNYIPAIYALRNRDFEAAQRHMRDAWAQDPDNTHLAQQHLRLSLLQGKTEEAEAAARALVSQVPDDNTARTLLAVIALRDGRAEAALEHLGRAGIGEAQRTALLKAATLAALENEAAALRAVSGIADRSGWEDATLFFETLLLHLFGQSAVAIAKVEAAIADETLNVPQVYLALGAMLEQSGTSERAGELYAEAVAENPGVYSIEARAAMHDSGAPPPRLFATPSEAGARFLVELVRVQSAFSQAPTDLVETLSLALILDPQLEDAHFLAGDAWVELRDSESAHRSFGAVKRDKALRWSARLRQAELHTRNQEYKEAEAILTRLKNPLRRHELPLQAANTQRLQQHWDAAIEFYTEALELRPVELEGRWWLRYARGICHERNEQWEEAEIDFLAALALEPESSEVLNYLAYAWADRGENLERALEMLQLAVASSPQQGHIIDSLGWVYYRLENYTFATSYLEEAAGILPTDATVNDHLGDAYWQAGRKREARIQWQRALSQGDHPEGDEYLEDKLRRGLDAAP